MTKPFKVLDIELQYPLEGLVGLHGYDTVCALIGYMAIPLGYVTIPFTKVTVQPQWSIKLSLSSKV